MGMRFSEVRIHNFGPYQGSQVLAFGTEKPIVLVHGSNMAGKTSLLNAIRWVLYGQALNRFGKPIPLKQLVNSGAARSGDWIMFVELNFEVDYVSFNLERRIQPKDSNAIPRINGDFEMKCFLKKNGRYLETSEVQTEINRIIPQQISRFFLFDGELLSEYETLLSSADKQSNLIKESIEHILGVPALLNAIADINAHLRDAGRRQLNLARQYNQAQAYTSEGLSISAKIASKEQDLTALRGQHEELSNRQKILDELLQSVSGIEVDIQRLQDLELRTKRLREEKHNIQQDNRDKFAHAWIDILQPTVQKHILLLEAEQENHLKGVRREGELQIELNNIEALLNSHVCPLCGQQQSQIKQEELQAQQRSLEEELEKLQHDQQQYGKVAESLRNLRKFKPVHVMGIIANNELRLLRIEVELTDLELKMDAINDRLKGHDKSEIARNRREYVDITKELGVIEKSILNKEEEIQKLQSDAAKNRLRISEVSGPELQRLNREVKICEELVTIFERTVKRLRDELRRSVETDANNIFKRLITDKTYKGLRINEQYGLTIIDADDHEVPVRSAGAEQIVALSLIGALNRNAIRQGPIIMDTPFGRLDTRHRENILRFIPTLAEQVTLLVHDGELDRDRDLKIVNEQIDNEYQINHTSSFKSEIVRTSEVIIQ